MPTPTYVSGGSTVKGVVQAESGINIGSFNEEFINEKEYVLDRFGARTGFAQDFEISSTCTIEGEITTALASVAGVAWATAETVAGATTGYGISSGDYLLDSISIAQDRGSFITASINLTIINGLTVA